MLQIVPEKIQQNTNTPVLAHTHAKSDFIFVSDSAAEQWPVEACIEVLRCANTLIGTDTYSWRHSVGAHNFLKTSSNSLKETIVLIGSTDKRWVLPECYQSKMRHRLKRAKRVCSVGAGLFILHDTGLHDLQGTAVHQNFRTVLAEIDPMIEFSDVTTSHKQNVSSSVSGIAAVQMMIELLDFEHGSVVTSAICNYLGFESTKKKVTTKTQWRLSTYAADDQIVSDAIEIMAENLEQVLSIKQVAQTLGFSARHLERRFKNSISISPYQVYVNMRLERAHQLLSQSDLSVSEIVYACGYSALPAMSRPYKNKYGVVPSETRNIARFGPSYTFMEDQDIRAFKR
jgi:transcriptional regulator GlxA family with amidase domain